MTAQSQIEVQVGAKKSLKDKGRRKNATLWTVQALLAALFLFSGGTKLIVPIDAMLKQMPVALPGSFLRFIGICEVLGAVGLILPGVVRIRRELTPLAASGLVVIMIGATAVTVAGGGGLTVVMPFTVGVLLVCVAHGRREYLGRFAQTSNLQTKTSIA